MESFILSTMASLLSVRPQSNRHTGLLLFIHSWHRDREQRRERQWCNLVATLWVLTSHPAAYHHRLGATHPLPKGWRSVMSRTQQNNKKTQAESRLSVDKYTTTHGHAWWLRGIIFVWVYRGTPQNSIEIVTLENSFCWEKKLETPQYAVCIV